MSNFKTEVGTAWDHTGVNSVRAYVDDNAQYVSIEFETTNTAAGIWIDTASLERVIAMLTSAAEFIAKKRGDL